MLTPGQQSAASTGPYISPSTSSETAKDGRPAFQPQPLLIKTTHVTPSIGAPSPQSHFPSPDCSSSASCLLVPTGIAMSDEERGGHSGTQSSSQAPLPSSITSMPSPDFGMDRWMAVDVPKPPPDPDGGYDSSHVAKRYVQQGSLPQPPQGGPAQAGGTSSDSDTSLAMFAPVFAFDEQSKEVIDNRRTNTAVLRGGHSTASPFGSPASLHEANIQQRKGKGDLAANSVAGEVNGKPLPCNSSLSSLLMMQSTGSPSVNPAGGFDRIMHARRMANLTPPPSRLGLATPPPRTKSAGVRTPAPAADEGKPIGFDVSPSPSMDSQTWAEPLKPFKASAIGAGVPADSALASTSHVHDRLSDVIKQLPTSQQRAALLFLEGLLSDATKEGATKANDSASSSLVKEPNLASSSSSSSVAAEDAHQPTRRRKHITGAGLPSLLGKSPDDDFLPPVPRTSPNMPNFSVKSFNVGVEAVVQDALSMSVLRTIEESSETKNNGGSYSGIRQPSPMSNPHSPHSIGSRDSDHHLSSGVHGGGKKFPVDAAAVPPRSPKPPRLPTPLPPTNSSGATSPKDYADARFLTPPPKISASSEQISIRAKVKGTPAASISHDTSSLESSHGTETTIGMKSATSLHRDPAPSTKPHSFASLHWDARGPGRLSTIRTPAASPSGTVTPGGDDASSALITKSATSVPDDDEALSSAFVSRSRRRRRRGRKGCSTNNYVPLDGNEEEDDDGSADGSSMLDQSLPEHLISDAVAGASHHCSNHSSAEISPLELKELFLLMSHYEPFYHLSEGQLHAVCQCLKRSVYNKNSTVVSEGGPPLQSLILLMNGRISVETGGKSHGAITPRTLYGELEMSYNLERASTTLRVVSKTATVYALPHKDFDTFVVEERKRQLCDVASYVNRTELFQVLSVRSRDLLSKAFSLSRVSEGTVLTVFNKFVDTMFIIVSGTVQMRARSAQTADLSQSSSVTISPMNASTSTTREVVMTKGPGDLVGEPEFMFKMAAMFDAVALTSLQVAKVSWLQFETSISHTHIHALKYFISSDPAYDYYQQNATPELLYEMKLVRHREKAKHQLQGSGESSNAFVMIGEASPSLSIEGGSISTSSPSSYDLAKVTDPHFSSSDTLLQRSVPLPPAASRYQPAAARKKGESLLSPGSSMNRMAPSARRGSRRVQPLDGRPISNLGEIVFSGSKKLYRFRADALDTNGSTLVGVIVDGTILRWNAVMHRITGYSASDVIGHNIYHLLGNEESRQRMRSALQLSIQYTEAWEQYAKEGLSHQSVYSFRHHTGLYSIGIAFSVVPSCCEGTAQVMLLIGRAAQMRSASHYAEDVTRWLESSLAPQLRVCQDYVSALSSNRLESNSEEVGRLQASVDICGYMVQQFIRFSKLNQESFNLALRPLRLTALMRFLTKEAWGLVKQTIHSFNSNFDSIPQLEVFMDPEKVSKVLKTLVSEILRSEDVSGSPISIALLVTIVEPEAFQDADLDAFNIACPYPSRRDSAVSSAVSSLHPSPTSQCKEPPSYASAPFPSAYNGVRSGTATEPSPTDSAAPAGAAVYNGSRPAYGTTGEESSTPSLGRQSVGQVSPAAPRSLEHILGLHTPLLFHTTSGNVDALCSVRRLRFELRNSGGPLSFSPTNEESTSPLVLRPQERRGSPAVSPIVSNSGSSRKFPVNPPRHMHGMEKLSPIISDLGGIVYGFYRAELESNVMRLELPLLVAPGKARAGADGAPDDIEEVDEQGEAPISSGTHTVIVADNNRVQTNSLCQILWARQHAVVPVSSYSELMRQMENGVGSILMIDPINLSISEKEVEQLHGDNPFDVIVEKSSGVVMVVMIADWGDWRVQRLLSVRNAIKLPKTGAIAQIHIAIQVAEKQVAALQEERERFEIIRRTFTSAVPNRHKKVKLLGKGAFGDVFEVEDTLTGGRMAMKEMRLSNTVDADSVLQELLAMTTLQHNNIIRYFFCEKAADNSTLQLYMEIAPGGTLKDRVRADGMKGLPLKEIVYHLHELCAGLSYIHSQRYIHRDIKPANLLLDKQNQVKIGDFGTAKKVKPHGQLFRMVGTPQYMAPEVFSANSEEMMGYSFPVDIWSVGCVAMELATGQPPFSHLDNAQGVGIIKYVADLSDEPDITPLASHHPLLYQFVRECLQVDPLSRPTAEELTEHELFAVCLEELRDERRSPHTSFCGGGAARWSLEPGSHSSPVPSFLPPTHEPTILQPLKESFEKGGNEGSSEREASHHLNGSEPVSHSFPQPPPPAAVASASVEEAVTTAVPVSAPMRWHDADFFSSSSDGESFGD